jgi:phosphate-selective porin OprO/OprP
VPYVFSDFKGSNMIRVEFVSGNTILLSALLFCWMTVFSVPATAQNRAAGATPETILVRNVTLIDQSGKSEDTTVSILIRDGKLDVITQEEIAVDTVELALDAQDGIVLGKLEVGAPANFMILAGDPREEFGILLDTATYARFAIWGGAIVRNRLPRALDPGDKPKRSGWLAYTAPPLALPSSYQNTAKWNRWETKFFSGIFVAAVVLDRQNWQYQDGNSEIQLGNLNSYDGGEIRGLRFGVVGTLNFPQPWVYTLFAATTAFDKGFDTDQDDDLAFLDWRLDIPTFAGTTLSVGKQKEPLSLEKTTGMIYLPMQERSAMTDAMLPSRNVGVVLSGRAFDERITWAGGVFNDWLETSDSFSDSAVQYIGRVTGVPFVSADESNLLHLGVGLRYTDAKEGLRYATEPEFDQSPVFVDTDEFDADSGTIYNAEASWLKGPFWLLGEYVFNDVDAPALGNPDFTGYYLTGSWALTGEMRSYNRKSGIFNPLPIAKPTDQGGWGAWEATARWSDLALTDGGIDGGELEIFSLGLSWWLSPIFKVDFNYRWITLDRFGVQGNSSGFNTRVLLIME